MGYTVILKYLKEVNLPLVPNFFNKSLNKDFKFNWVKSEVAIKKILAMDVFLHLTIDSNIYETNKNAIYMGSPTNESPLPR